MFKTEVKEASTSRTSTFRRMKHGEIGRMKDGTIVLRTFEAVVSLSTPGAIWSHTYGLPDSDVVLLPAGSTVTLTVQGNN